MPTEYVSRSDAKRDKQLRDERSNAKVQEKKRLEIRSGHGTPARYKAQGQAVSVSGTQQHFAPSHHPSPQHAISNIGHEYDEANCRTSRTQVDLQDHERRSDSGTKPNLSQQPQPSSAPEPLTPYMPASRVPPITSVKSDVYPTNTQPRRLPPSELEGEKSGYKPATSWTEKSLNPRSQPQTATIPQSSPYMPGSLPPYMPAPQIPPAPSFRQRSDDYPTGTMMSGQHLSVRSDVEMDDRRTISRVLSHSSQNDHQQQHGRNSIGLDRSSAQVVGGCGSTEPRPFNLPVPHQPPDHPPQPRAYLPPHSPHQLFDPPPGHQSLALHQTSRLYSSRPSIEQAEHSPVTSRIDSQVYQKSQPGLHEKAPSRNSDSPRRLESELNPSSELRHPSGRIERRRDSKPDPKITHPRPPQPRPPQPKPRPPPIPPAKPGASLKPVTGSGQRAEF